MISPTAIENLKASLRGELLRPLLLLTGLGSIRGRQRHIDRKIVGTAGARFP